MIFEHMEPDSIWAGEFGNGYGDVPSRWGQGLFENVGTSYVRIVEHMLGSILNPGGILRVTNPSVSAETQAVTCCSASSRDVVIIKTRLVLSICIGINDVLETSTTAAASRDRAVSAGGEPFPTSTKKILTASKKM